MSGTSSESFTFKEAVVATTKSVKEKGKFISILHVFFYYFRFDNDINLRTFLYNNKFSRKL